MIVNHGVQIQTSVNTMIANAGQRSASQAWGAKPSPSQTAATTPNWSLKIQRIIVAAITGAIISGSRMHRLHQPLADEVAVQEMRERQARGTSEIATELTISSSVLGSTRPRNTGSVSTRM